MRKACFKFDVKLIILEVIRRIPMLFGCDFLEFGMTLRKMAIHYVDESFDM